MRILLVEDEESLRITLAANLELEGHIVLEAADGQQAIEVLRRSQVDLVLSDIRMPNLGGIGLLKFVKREHPEVPVVLMTAYTAEEQVETAVSAGVFSVLRKPFDLGRTIQSLVRAAQGPLVLVVDDDRADANSLTQSLKRAGVKAEAVFDGEAALEAIRSRLVDVCVTDLVMSGAGSGPELMKKMREIDPTLALIVLSSHDVGDMIQRVSDRGISACLRKPVDPEELLHSVAKARGGQWAL